MSARGREPLTSVSQIGGTASDPATHTGHPADPDLLIRTPPHWLAPRTDLRIRRPRPPRARSGSHRRHRPTKVIPT